MLRAGVTELDNVEGYHETLRDLKAEKLPVGAIEILASCRIRSSGDSKVTACKAALSRIHHKCVKSSHEATPFASLSSFDEGVLVDPGLPEIMHHDDVQVLVSTFQRYESAITLRLFCALHELERLQRVRQGEKLPAPTVIDVTIDVDRHVTAGPSADHVFEGSLSPHPEKGAEPKS